MKKAEIYKAYGIEYKSGKIKTPYGEFIPELIPVGTNTKVGNAGTWSIYHGNEIINSEAAHNKVKAVMEKTGIESVKGPCPCHCKNCYCDFGFYNFPANKAIAVRKLILAKYFTEWMTNAIIAQIKADNIKQLRIHAQGDFFSREYCKAWEKIANETKDICVFWTYTKNPDALEILSGISNLSIVPSITPFGFNFGTCSELLDMHDKLTKAGYRTHICACGTEHEKHCSDCKTGCKAIGKKCDFVLFIKHSCNTYEAGKDDPEEYKAVCNIIANQEN